MNRKTIILFTLAGLLATLYGFIPLYISESNADQMRTNHESVKEANSPVSEGVRINEQQAEEITLTLIEVSVQKVEKWIRTAGSVDNATGNVRGRVYGVDKALVQIDQKVRIFPLVSREPVLQGRIVRIVSDGEETIVETDLKGMLYKGTQLYIMEIIVDLGKHLTVPNEAIIEEETNRLAYVQKENNLYVRQIIKTGARGELYTQVLDGLVAGEKVVTFGSFFIDAQHKLLYKNHPAKNSNSKKEGPVAHQHH